MRELLVRFPLVLNFGFETYIIPIVGMQLPTLTQVIFHFLGSEEKLPTT